MAIFPQAPEIDHGRVTAAIEAAEKISSGEIRVVISHRKAADPVSAAQNEFERLGMAKTSHRNGVLVFLAPESRKFAVIGDSAIHEKCGEPFWRLLAAAMSSHFQKGDFTGGLVHGIERAGAILAEHFPHGPDDRNQLPNEIEETS